MFAKKQKQDVVTSLQHKTADILGAFTTAIDGLSSVADEAIMQSANKTTEANKLLTEAETLKQLARKNHNIADRLNEIIS